ncbi:MAG TPA: hypothetical protein VGI41_08555 [Candidatus Udaeobacter sp.]|jgi:hypothetical protein
MAIVAQAEQNQVVSVNVFAALCRQEIKLILVFPRGDFRIGFTAHSHDRFSGMAAGINSASRAILKLL